MVTTYHRTIPSLLLLFLLAAPTPAGAMRIRTNVRLLAWSTDGLSFLLEVNQGGPEGGGSLGYQVHDTRDGSARAFTISSDFSPGDGSTPQAIRAEQCRQTAAGLARSITSKGIKGVIIRPDSCGGKRHMVLTTSEAATKRVSAGAFVSQKGSAFRLTRGELTVRVVGKRLMLWKGKRKPKSSPEKDAEAEVEAYLAPGGEVVLALVRWGGSYSDLRLGKVWRKKKGSWKEVKMKTSKM